MPTKEQIEAWKAAGEASHLARKHQERGGGRTADEIKRLRKTAAQASAICGECFAPLPLDASVTLAVRFVEHIPKHTHPIGIAIPPRDHHLQMPICLSCWLVDITKSGIASHMRGLRQNAPIVRAGPYRVVRRLRCENCDRPMRIERSPYLSSRLTLADRACCLDCFHKATLRRANKRRRVHHQDIVCVVCGKMFAPKQSTAKTCSNVCRQRLFRQRG